MPLEPVFVGWNDFGFSVNDSGHAPDDSCSRGRVIHGEFSVSDASAGHATLNADFAAATEHELISLRELRSP